ncbi:MAG: rRNA maturation RNase YbeY [Gemmatimonadota bacterium]
MTVLVEVGDYANVDAEVLEEAVRHTVAREGGEVIEISLALLGDDDLRELNRRFLGHDRPTDVIAFTLGEDAERVGDVYLGVDQARRQAEELGIPVDQELVRLAVHGTLHVLGHDHPEGEDRYDSPMFILQERIVAELTEDGAA